MSTTIPLSRPTVTGNEQSFLNEVFESKKFSGNGPFTQKCQGLIRDFTQSSKVLMTTSCTHALELATLLLNIGPGDEVILPTYTFSSTANAFLLRGAKLKFVDSRPDHPGMDEAGIIALINERTKAIVPVHYAGVACNMDIINDAASKNGVAVVEDAAHAISGSFIGSNGQSIPLGSAGDLGVFSFHITKNIQCGEGGALLINDGSYSERAEIIWEKGTNRAAFSRNEIERYEWLDIGSSYLPSEMVTAFLFAQLKELNRLQEQRLNVWNRYFNELDRCREFGVSLPFVPTYALHNGHIFYVTCKDQEQRDFLIQFLAKQDIVAASHYQPLHTAPFLQENTQPGAYPNSQKYFQQLLRLPVYADLTEGEQARVIDAVLLGLKSFETRSKS